MLRWLLCLLPAGSGWVLPPRCSAPGSHFSPTPPTAGTGHPTWGLLGWEDLGSGPALERPTCCLSAQGPRPHGEPQRPFPWDRPGHTGKRDQLYRVLILTRHEPRQGLGWSDRRAPGFREAGRRQPRRPDISSPSSEQGTGSRSTRCATKPAASRGFPFR